MGADPIDDKIANLDIGAFEDLCSLKHVVSTSSIQTIIVDGYAELSVRRESSALVVELHDALTLRAGEIDGIIDPFREIEIVSRDRGID